jgi:hypothetical protein
MPSLEIALEISRGFFSSTTGAARGSRLVRISRGALPLGALFGTFSVAKIFYACPWAVLRGTMP